VGCSFWCWGSCAATPTVGTLHTLAELGGGGLMLAAFVTVEWRTRTPMLPLGLFRRAAAQTHAVINAMSPWSAPHMYLNFAETQRDPATFWTETAHHRLCQVKAEVDPEGRIRSNHPVSSTATGRVSQPSVPPQ
jgi:hypothetical protein